MTEAVFVTIACPHCTKQLRVSAEDAGHQVPCPHPKCGQLVPVPLAPEEDEPDEPVVLPEDPANPQQVPLAVAAEPAPPSEPRQEPRYYEEVDDPPRPPILPWALTAFAFLLAAGAVMGWVVTATQNDPDALAALEAKNRALRTENETLRDRLNATKTAAPAPTGPQVPVPAPRPNGDPPSGRPNPDPPAKSPDEPKPPFRVEPLPKQRDGRDAFVGKWAVTDQQIEKSGAELTVEFRADGTCALSARTGGGGQQELPGTWRWDGRQLHLSISGMQSTPAEVEWNGPDEFVGTADNVPSTFRRKK